MKTYLKSVRELIIFALPVVAGEVSQVLFGIGDVLVAGRYSTLVLAALGVACAFFFPFMVFGLGLMSAISPLKARRIGAGECVKKVPASSFSLATIVGIGLTLLLLLTTKFIVPLIGYDLEFQGLVQSYLYICAFSITPALIFAAINENLLAQSYTIIPNLMIFLFNFFNIAANIVLMFVFDLGIVGAAIATLLSRTLMAISLYVYSLKKCQWHWKICKKTIYEVIKVGIPAGGSILVVALVFAIVALMVGKMSLVAAATNNVLINLTSFTFMIPMALSNVTAVKVGHVFGRKNMKMVKTYTLAALSISFVIALVGALIFLILPVPVLRLFTDQPEVIEYGTVLLVYIAVYQIPDALQAILCGALRGLGETAIPLGFGFISVWMIGLPIGCYLAYTHEMGAAGLWAGLATGLTCLSIMLASYFVLRLKRLKSSS